MGLLLNKVRDKSFEVNIGDIELATNVPVLAVLPDDIKALEALSKAVPAVAHTPRGNLSMEYKKLGGCLVGVNYKDQRLMTKLKGIFAREIPKQEVNRCCMLEGLHK